MLDPIYYSRLRKTTRIDGYVEVTIDETDLSPGFYFKILGYSKSRDYTLVFWREGKGGDYDVFGENLWRGTTPLDTDSGQIDLPIPPEPGPRGTPIAPIRTWDRIQPMLGVGGITPAIAKELRSFKNRRTLIQ